LELNIRNKKRRNALCTDATEYSIGASSRLDRRAAASDAAIWLSFPNWSTQTGVETASFIGLQSFIDIFGPSIGRNFKTAPANTALYTLPSLALILPARSPEAR
jgi:hypothetical protein